MPNIWPATNENTVFTYGFFVWPDETYFRMQRCPAVWTLFRQMNMRQEFDFTERDFNEFREQLAKIGLTLREITRVPMLDPDLVL